MKILVIGNGGREHALAWKLAQSPMVNRVYVAPGNAGTYREPKVENVAIDSLDFSALTDFVKHQQIDFTVVGPEAPLVAGIVDYFSDRNLPCLGPDSYCAQLEGSKAFAKEFMTKHHIPTAKAHIFTSITPAMDYLQSCTYPVVIKASGLAAGKGVVIAHSAPVAQATIESMLAHKIFGDAGEQIIIEDFIEGEEVSFIVLCDGKSIIPFASSQDHKARDEGDRGPNTGGMGAYSPAPIVTAQLHEQIMQQVILPTINGISEDGHTYKGFLYAGLMITPDQNIKVLEYNCRFGDPETQPILMRLTSDFALMCQMALAGTLSEYASQWDPRPALGVVLALHGYPDKYNVGETITTLHDITPSDQYKIFHAGTKMIEGRIVTSGGRVLCVTALGEDIAKAQENAYRLVKKVKWDGVFCRNDIGYRALS